MRLPLVLFRLCTVVQCPCSTQVTLAQKLRADAVPRVSLVVNPLLPSLLPLANNHSFQVIALPRFRLDFFDDR